MGLNDYNNHNIAWYMLIESVHTLKTLLVYAMPCIL